MEDKPSTGFERQKETPERITIIGREMPMARDIYDSLSDEKNILVYSDANSIIRKGNKYKRFSEQELFDDLLDFCTRCRDMPAEDGPDPYGYNRAIRNIDTFLDSMTYLSKEMYTEAVKGLAAHHSEWLSQNPQNRLLFVIPDSRKQKSQNMVTSDTARQIDQSVSERVTVASNSDLTATMLDSDTKVILCDDWAVSGNHIANDLGSLFQRLDAQGIGAHELTVEVNLLVARSDQVKEGIGAVDRLKEYFPEYMMKEPTMVSYFEAPVTYGSTTPTGSHSAADYGFATTLDSMLTIAQRHGVADRMPYIGVIIPEYSYDHKHIDK